MKEAQHAEREGITKGEDETKCESLRRCCSSLSIYLKGHSDFPYVEEIIPGSRRRCIRIDHSEFLELTTDTEEIGLPRLKDVSDLE